jgi:hypothetical protein
MNEQDGRNGTGWDTRKREREREANCRPEGNEENGEAH